MEVNQNDEEIKLAITVNNRHFVVSINELVKMLSDKSNTIDLSKIDTKNKKNARFATNHIRLRTNCKHIQENISLSGENAKNEFDTAGIIKKIYKTLTRNFSKLYPTPDLSLFELLNEHGERITIIPGLDINLVSKLFTNDELVLFWGYMYMMYISVANLISIFNNHKEKGEVWEAMPSMKLYIAKSGILKDGKFFNPFLGITKDKNGEYGVNEMFKNIGKPERPTGVNMTDLVKMVGIDNLIPADQMQALSDQLKDISEEDITSSINQALDFMGAHDNPDIKEVCTELTRGIVSDLQTKGTFELSSITDSVQNVVDKIGSKLDKNKMLKTAEQLKSRMQNGEESLKNMKDDKGNPIGMDLFNKLSGPLELLKKMGGMAQTEQQKDTDSVGSKGSAKKKK